MDLSKVERIEREIGMLSAKERTELYARLDQVYSDALDEQLREDIEAGKLDHLIDSALDDLKHGRVRPL